MLIVVFGLPGSGKSYVGTILKKEFDFCLYDGDIDLPRDIKDAIANKTLITDTMRDEFFKRVICQIKRLKKTHRKLVVAQTFIKEKYRKLVLKHFPDTQFILIKTKTSLRESRIAQRKYYHLDRAYAQAMCRNFESSRINHAVLDNNTDGEEEIKKQLKKINNAFGNRLF